MCGVSICLFVFAWVCVGSVGLCKFTSCVCVAMLRKLISVVNREV